MKTENCKVSWDNGKLVRELLLYLCLKLNFYTLAYSLLCTFYQIIRVVFQSYTRITSSGGSGSHNRIHSRNYSCNHTCGYICLGRYGFRLVLLRFL